MQAPGKRSRTLRLESGKRCVAPLRSDRPGLGRPERLHGPAPGPRRGRLRLQVAGRTPGPGPGAPRVARIEGGGPPEPGSRPRGGSRGSEGSEEHGALAGRQERLGRARVGCKVKEGQAEGSVLVFREREVSA